MFQIDRFTFNAFQENTYVLSDSESLECFIIDPGNSNSGEDAELLNFLKDEKLVPKRLINTHCHIDHVLGNQKIADKFGLTLEAHKNEVPVLQSCLQVSKMYGIPFRGSPEIGVFIEEGDTIQLGEHQIEFLLTPGHSPGSICLYIPSEKTVIGGDVLFQGSIGRTDLPGGDYATLINSIRTRLLTLEDEVVVYPGHGPETTIGFERRRNPFLNGSM